MLTAGETEAQVGEMICPRSQELVNAELGCSRQPWTADRRQQTDVSSQAGSWRKPRRETSSVILFTDVVTLLSPRLYCGRRTPRQSGDTEVSYHMKSHPLPPPSQPGAGEPMRMLAQPCRPPPSTPAHRTHSDLRKVSDEGPAASLSSGHLCTGLPRGGHVQDGQLGQALQHSSQVLPCQAPPGHPPHPPGGLEVPPLDWHLLSCS